MLHTRNGHTCMADISETVPHFKAKFRVDTEETWSY